MHRAGDNSNKKTLTKRVRTSLPWVVLLCVVALSSGGVRSADAQTAADEYKVKAAFVFHFAQLVDWPSDAPKGTDESFDVCLPDDESHRQELQSTLEGKPIGNRTMHVRLLNKSQSAEGCRIFFLSRNAGRRQAEFLRTLHGQPVLTVGDADTFLTEGGMIRLHFEQDKIRFDINVGAAELCHLKISSRLLLLATSVTESGGTRGGN